MRALILGSGGQVGACLAQLLPDASAHPRTEVSIADEAALATFFDRVRPEIVINAAAYNAVDRAEEEPEMAMAVNAEGPRLLAGLCRSHRCRLVHFSTNYVFDGDQDRPYVESDEPHPLGVYARSKLEGERWVRELPDSLVIRTAAVYAQGGARSKGGSLPERVLTAAREGRAVRMVADQCVNPTLAADLAQGTVELIEQGLTGVVHLVNRGCATYFEFVKAFLAGFGLEDCVNPVTTNELAAKSLRPRNGCMDSERVPLLRPWEEALADFSSQLAHWKPGF